MTILFKMDQVQVPLKFLEGVPGKHSVPFFRQLWLVLRVKLMEINSNLSSRYLESEFIPICSMYVKVILYF